MILFTLVFDFIAHTRRRGWVAIKEAPGWCCSMEPEWKGMVIRLDLGQIHSPVLIVDILKGRIPWYTEDQRNWNYDWHPCGFISTTAFKTFLQQQLIWGLRFLLILGQHVKEGCVICGGRGMQVGVGISRHLTIWSWCINIFWFLYMIYFFSLCDYLLLLKHSVFVMTHHSNKQINLRPLSFINAIVVTNGRGVSTGTF